MTARILDVDPATYHTLPGLSASIATKLIQRSPLHAWSEYNGDRDDPTKRMDRGSVVHRMLLGKGANYACLPYDNWTTKAARESRDKTRESGVIPLTHVQHTEYEVATREIRKRLDEAGHFLSSTTGHSELAIAWQEPTPNGPVDCRCMIDHVDLERGLLYEVKIVDDAHPEAIERSAENMGYRIPAAAYIRALVALRPELMGRIVYRFLFCEAVEPYAFYDPEPDDGFLETGDRDWRRAVTRWGECSADNRWPHYQAYGYISRPTWALRREGYTTDEQ